MKVNNPDLYMECEIDPRQSLHGELLNTRMIGKQKKCVNEHTALKIVGITPNNNKSTVSNFKPGFPYFTPTLKIHKVENLNDLTPGIEPPARIITALQNGVTKRSDVFLAVTFLKAIEKDF